MLVLAFNIITLLSLGCPYVDYWDCSSQSYPFLSLLLANTEIPISSCIPVTDICLIRYSDHKRLILTPYTTDLDQISQDKQSFQPQICELDDYQSFEEQACYYLERYKHQDKFKLIEIDKRIK